jgi:hypothetical protein
VEDKRNYVVFRDDLGNRMLLSGVYDQGADFWRCLEISLTLGITREDDFYEVPIVDDELCFPHVKVEVTHPSFFHGYCDGYLIGGPTFDEVARESGDA